MTAKDIMQIREQHDLDAYLYADRDHPFRVLSDRESHENLSWHMERYGELFLALQGIVDAVDAGLLPLQEIEGARSLVYSDKGEKEND